MSPEALDGLEGFSHVWLSFKFHLNTNTLDEAKAFQGVEGSNQKFTFTAKITPPVRTHATSRPWLLSGDMTSDNNGNAL